MRSKLFLALLVAAAIGAVAALTPISLVARGDAAAAGQAKTPDAHASASPWNPPRTADGQPDMQGYWLPDAAGVGHSIEEGEDPGNNGGFGVSGNVPGGASDGGRSRAPIKQVIVDTPDKRIPYQPWALAKKREILVNLFTPTDPSQLDPDDRCFLWGAVHTGYARSTHHLRIIQTPGFVLFTWEDLHPYRIVPIDGRPHVGGNIQLWEGDSRGHWEGNTLVVDVTNSNDQPWLDAHGSFYRTALHVVERWTFAGPDRIDYQARLEDPNVFTRPFTIAYEIKRNKAPGFEILENACFEGERSTAHMIAAGKIEKAAGRTGIHTHNLPESIK